MSSRAGRCFLSLAIVAVVFGMAPLVPAQMRKAWVATYDSPDKDRDVPAALAVDPLGNIVVSGYSRSGSLSSTADFATVKYSPSGQELWAQVYDGPAGSSDVPTGLAIDHLGYIFVTGPSARASETESDYATVKYDADGTELWVRRYEGPGGFDAIPCAVAVDADGNAVVTGESASITETNLEFTTVKYDPDGRELWVRRYGGPGQACRPRALAIDAAGHVLVTGEGHFGDARYSDFVTVKYSPDGGELWVRRFDGLGGLADIPVGIAVDPAGNVHVAGESRSSGGSGTDYATVKYAPDGTRLWVREYKGPANKSDRPVAVAVDAAGKVHVTGVSPGESTKVDWATLAYDRDGNELWVARYAEQYSSGKAPKAMVLDAAGNVLVAGSLGSGTSDYAGMHAVIKYDPQGRMLWATEQPVGIAALAADAEGGVFVAGELDRHFATVKYESPPLMRGRIDADDDLDITDAIVLLEYLFFEGEVPACLDAADVDDDGAIELTDPIWVLNHLFHGGSPPADPSLECGRDLTLDGLECAVSETCSPSRGLPTSLLFTREFQANGVFFVVDRSGSMLNGGLDFAKREISRTIGEFPETVEFGIVFFDVDPLLFPSSGMPTTADPAAKLEATNFVESMEGGDGCCCLPGLLAGLEFAKKSKAERKILIYVSDDGGTCDGADEALYLRQARRETRARNTHGVEIHCVGMLSPSVLSLDFMRKLAWENGGSYTRIAR